VNSTIGRVVAVLATLDPKAFPTAPVDELTVGFAGVAGDLHAGMTRVAGSREQWLPRDLVVRNDRQLSALGEEELAIVAADLGIEALDAGLIGANLVITGFANFSHLAPGSRLAFGGQWRGTGRFDGRAILRIEAYNRPCRQSGRRLASAHPGRADIELAFVKAAKFRRGLVLSVDYPGRIAAGEDVVLIPPLLP
jgi:hypothetical protein